MHRMGLITLGVLSMDEENRDDYFHVGENPSLQGHALRFSVFLLCVIQYVLAILKWIYA